MKHSFSITRSTNPKQKPNPDKLVFGETFTDHMFIMDYSKDKGWHDGRIVRTVQFRLNRLRLCFNMRLKCSKA